MKGIVQYITEDKLYMPERFEVSTNNVIDGAKYKVTVFSDRWDTVGHFFCDAKGEIVYSSGSGYFTSDQNEKYDKVSKPLYNPAIADKFKSLAKKGFPDKKYGIVCDPNERWSTVPLDIIRYPYVWNTKMFRNIM